jgi:hypothetical protein
MGFINSLKVELVQDVADSGRGLWQLLEPLYYLDRPGTPLLIVPEGFVTDFASVPRIPIAFLLCGDTAHPAAALHDFLYSTPHRTTRADADRILREAAISCGVPAWRAAMLYAGVRVGGASHWD